MAINGDDTDDDHNDNYSINNKNDNNYDNDDTWDGVIILIMQCHSDLPKYIFIELPLLLNWGLQNDNDNDDT